MRYLNIALNELGRRDLDAWKRFAAPDGDLISPCLRPEFAQAVDAVRGDVRVIIAEDREGPAAFFAHHAPDGGVIRPAGAALADHQGAVARPGARIETKALLKAAGAGALVYENWSASPPPGKVRERDGAAIADLSGGAERWFENRRALHRDHFRKMDRRARKAEREFGPKRVVFGDPLGERFAALKRWKSAQYANAGKLDVFSIDWADRLLSDLAMRCFGPFRGVVASVYFGEELAAVEFGVACEGTYHSWFPAYDPRFACVSPGLQVLHGVIEAAPRLKIKRIDLGKGEKHYKKYYSDYEIPLAQGRALTPGAAAARVAGWECAEQAAAFLPDPMAEAPLKLRRRWSQTAGFAPELQRRLALMGEAVGARLVSPRRATLS